MPCNALTECELVIFLPRTCSQVAEWCVSLSSSITGVRACAPIGVLFLLSMVW